MPCPECGAKNRLCVKNGKIFRKTSADQSMRIGAKVQRYICQTCGYTGRGNFFKLPEFDTEQPNKIDQSEDSETD